MSSLPSFNRLCALVLSGILICAKAAHAGGSTTPSFTSSGSNQTLTVGTAYSFQVSASPTPIFTSTNLPPGLTMNSEGLIYGTPTTTGIYAVTITANNDNEQVQEMGVGANEQVTISSSTLGNDLNCYAGLLNLQLNGASAVGFCIDPWHFSVEGHALTFNWEALSIAPKAADGMGVATALQIEQLWQQYYSTSMSNSTAAGLQIAIWDLVSASISAQTSGTEWYTLDSSNDYGAASMIAWVNAHPLAAAANLDGLTGSGQDYVTQASGLPTTSLGTATQTITLAVYAKPVVNSGGSTIPVGQPYSYTIIATNAPASYAASGLPSGLSIDTTTGVISGTPTRTGTFPISLSATNPGGTGTGSLTLTITTAYTLTIAGSPSAGGSASGAGVYAAGTVVTISEAANAGYRTSGWSGTSVGSVASPTSTTTTITMTGNMSLTAGFVQQATLTIASATGGSATGAGTYDVGTSVPIVETAGSGYRTNGWSGSASITASSSASTTIVLNSNATITPSFVQQFTLAISSATGGTATGAGTYDAGTSVPIVETANSGYRTNGWSGSGNIASPSSASTTIVMNSNATIAPSFVQRVTLTINSATGGSATGAGTYDAGSTVSIVETANSGYRTNGWSGSSGIASPSSASTTITLNSNATITPSFVQQFTLAIAAATGGTATGAGTYDIGTNVTITETANSGYRTSGWSGSGAIASPSSPSTTILMNSSATITPSFVQRVTLTINSATGGTATGGGTYDIGSTVPISETAATGYRTNGWSGSSGITSPSSASTTIVLSASATISPSFVQQVTLTIASATGGSATGAGTFDVGTLVAIAETANSGYRTNGWSGSSSITSPSSASTTIALNANATITPSFVQQFTLTINSVTGGSATGAGTYDIGTAVPIVETASAGYRTNGWSGSGNIASPSRASTTIVMSANATISPSFVRQFTLTINPAGGGSATGAGTYDVGSTVPIVETANAGYRTNGWSGSSSIVAPSSASTTIVLNGDATISPLFVQQVTLTIASATGGTATGAGTYDIGSIVPIAETAGAGYRTNGWSGSPSIASPTSASTTIALTANTSISPSFVQQVTLTINAAIGGSATGAGTYDIGSIVPITETANSGYRTNGWTGSGSIASPSSTATTITLNASATISPSFVQQVTLTISAASGGSSTGAGLYDVGSTVPITETANAGYRAAGWTGSAAIAAPSNASTTIVLNTNTTIAPSFVQQVTLTINAALGGTTTGSGTYDIGSSVPIVETATSGYRTNGWSGSSNILSPSSASTSIVLNGNATIAPSFVQQVTLTINSVAGGTTTGAGTYDVGTTVPISETASAGYRTNGWSGSAGIISPSSASTTIVLNAPATITPTFIQQVTLTINSATGGTSTGAGTYDLGSTVPIAETADAGYRANGWTGPNWGSVTSPSSAVTSIVLNSNATIAPTFVQQVTLTVDAGNGGSATGGGTYDIGSSVPISAAPSSGYTFVDWTGASPASPTLGSTTLVVSGDTTITASFAPQPPTAILTAATTAYTGSNFNVTSTASAPAGNLTLHSIEWLSPTGAWTVSTVAASGSTSNRSLGISFPSTGVYTLRAGVSDDNGVTWYYSPSVPVTVSSGITTYTLQTMAVPTATALTWYSPSPVVQRAYQVQHVNPGN